MNSSLNADLATAILEDRIHKAERDRRASAAQAEEERDPYASVTVRLARATDHEAISRLEQLEGRRLPAEPTLVAEAEGRVLAVRSVRTRETLADPFRPTAQLVQLLDLRSVQLRHELDGGRRVAGGQMRRFVRAVIEPLRS